MIFAINEKPITLTQTMYFCDYWRSNDLNIKQFFTNPTNHNAKRLRMESVDKGWVRTNLLRQKTPNTTAKRVRMRKIQSKPFHSKGQK